MTKETLTTELAKRVMKWDAGPDRFLLGARRWMPRARFRPTERIADAFRLLEQAAPEEYSMGAGENGSFWVKVRVAGTTGEALEPSKPRAIAFAIARALGIPVDSSRVSVIDAADTRRRRDE